MATIPGLVTSQRQLNGKLIVNYVPQQMTEEELAGLFEAIGPLESCKVVKDRQNQSHDQGSLGYGFVVYQDPAVAEQAIAALNGLKVQNKRLKVSFARPSGTDIKNTNLYVAGLPMAVADDDALVELFRPYGNVIQARLLIDELGCPRNVGFVRYDSRKDAENAVQALNGHVPEGGSAPLTIRYAENPRAKAQQQQEQQGALLASVLAAQQQTGMMPSYDHPGSLPGVMPGALPPSPQGTANSLLSPNPNVQPFPPGYQPPVAGPMHGIGPAMPQMSPPYENQSMPAFGATGMNRLHQHRFNPLAASPGPQGFSVFVYNIPGDAQEILLYELFSPFGAIGNVKVIRDASGAGKGYAFVNMIKYDEAWQAIAALNGHEMEGKQLQVSFKTAKAPKQK